MLKLPDFGDLRYLNEVGWFLYREKYGHNPHTGSFTGERLTWSRMLLDEVTSYCGHDVHWVEDKTVVTVGCGCTGDLAAWPARVKIAVDPLLYTYQKLGMLVSDEPGTQPTICLATGIEGLALLDESADLVICRNALDHMPDPAAGLAQMWRILRSDGRFFLSVDIGGEPTPDEPSPFTAASLATLLDERFDVLVHESGLPGHNAGRACSVRIAAGKRPLPVPSLDKEGILRAYEASIGAGDRPVPDSAGRRPETP